MHRPAEQVDWPMARLAAQQQVHDRSRQDYLAATNRLYPNHFRRCIQQPVQHVLLVRLKLCGLLVLRYWLAVPVCRRDVPSP